jgi:hypothetical protein
MTALRWLVKIPLVIFVGAFGTYLWITPSDDVINHIRKLKAKFSEWRGTMDRNK